jgi:hypothetical protein
MYIATGVRMKFWLLAALSFGVITLIISSASVCAQQKRDTITEVTLEMVPGSYGSGREFKITFRQDGSALYHGKANVKLQGKYSGTLSKDEFDQLVKLIEEKNFSELKSTFPSSRSTALASNPNMPTLISPTVATSIVTNGKRRTIERVLNTKINYPNAPAKELLEIENAITSLAMKVKWTKTQK